MTRNLAISWWAALSFHGAVLVSVGPPLAEAPNRAGPAETYVEVDLTEPPSAPDSKGGVAAQDNPPADPAEFPSVVAPIIADAPSPEFEAEPLPEPATPVASLAEDNPIDLNPPRVQSEPAPAAQRVSAGAAGTSLADLARSSRALNGDDHDPELDGGRAAPTAAYFLKRVHPVYPREAKKRGQEGRVLLTVYLNIDGLADHIEVKESSGFPLLDEAAATAARRSRLRPTYSGNRPVRSRVEVPYRFMLTK